MNGEAILVGKARMGILGLGLGLKRRDWAENVVGSRKVCV